MTSTFRPFGLRPSRVLGGAPNNMATNRYPIANSYPTVIYKGDIVNVSLGYLDNRGTTNVSTNPGGIGVFNGAYWVSPDTKAPVWSNYFPASTSSAGVIEGFSTPLALVYDNPNMLYVVQADASLSLGDVGHFFNTSATTGDTNSGRSGLHLNRETKNVVGASADIQVVGLHDAPGNVWLDAFTHVEVRLVNHPMTINAGTSITTS
jgi:hypothetical protein